MKHDAHVVDFHTGRHAARRRHDPSEHEERQHAHRQEGSVGRPRRETAAMASVDEYTHSRKYL